MDRPLDGLVYGQAPSTLPDVPDVDGMFVAVGLPEEPEGGGLPHSLEWYAGAKDREAARREEMDELIIRRNDLRSEWTNLIKDNLGVWSEKVDTIAAEPPPKGLAVLLARTAHEQPGATEKIRDLQQLGIEAARKRELMAKELADCQDGLSICATIIQAAEDEAAAEEVKRLAKQEAERERKRRAEEALKRNEELLLGIAAGAANASPPGTAGAQDGAGTAEDGEPPGTADPPPPTTPAPAALGRKTSAAQLAPLKNPPVPPMGSP